jgi:hypothetical protein
MKLFGLAISAVCFAAATQSMAQNKKFAGYIIKSKTEVVEGVMLVNGYSNAEVMNFIREDCASGRLGSLQYVGKPRKKRGNHFQKFRTACVGGPNQRIGQTSSVTVEVERMPDGRNMTEYTYSISGNIAYSRYIR